MSNYLNIYHDRNTNLIHLWDDEKGYLKFEYQRYGFKKSNKGKYKTIDGVPVEKVTRWSNEDESKGLMYESDVRPVVRTLIDMYLESDTPSDKHNIMTYDIEVSGEGGYALPSNPTNPITSISFHLSSTNQYFVLLLDTDKRIDNKTIDNVFVYRFNTEVELLQEFLGLYVHHKPTIVTGWNIDYFDNPYLYNRLMTLLGVEYANLLSPIGIVNKDKFDVLEFAGVSFVDYLTLYKQYTYSEQPSYSLEAISRHELKRGKVSYEGTLDNLYNTDIDKFIKYNVTDVELVVEIDNKLKFILQALGVAHKGHVPLCDIFKTTRFLDGACLTYIRRLGIVAPNIRRREQSEIDKSNAGGAEFEGAYVKDPTPGRYEWVFDEDLESLYPNIIRTLNISPETKVTKVTNWGVDTDADSFIVDYKSNRLQLSRNDLFEFLKKHTFTISSTGVIYNNSVAGIIPSILNTWLSERAEYRSLAKKYGEQGDIVKRTFYDSRQLTAKIIANSLYGALGNGGFRFYDVDNAEAITLGGQEVIKYCNKISNEWYNTKLDTNNVDYVIYVDTDSMFLSAKPFIELLQNRMSKTCSKQESADITQKVSVELEKYINDSFPDFAKRTFNADTHFLKIKQEYVSESAFWVAKKRYAQKIVMEKGVSIDAMTKGEKKWKLDVKGMDVVRSNFPKSFREFMSKLLIMILDNEPKASIDSALLTFKDSISVSNVLDIMLPTGVKEISKYSTGTLFKRLKGTPAHVKAAMNYNDFLIYFNINSLPPIGNGDKIKWAYLLNNPYGVASVALKGYDDPKQIVDLVTQYIDRDALFESALTNKVQDFYNALNFGTVPVNNNINEFFSF
jgi:DNA polymerase elongation subunit (family B)